MEISAFAEQLLFGQTLENKLFEPTDRLTDEHPEISWQLPDFPGRPKELQLKPKNKRQKFPSIKHLEKDIWARGAAIHFFANHELLAIELMALLLLRFPNAPVEFRKSLVHTIKEEQQHMVLYKERMNQFGIGLGEIAVNEFFWKCCKDILDPAKFLLALSLTFEQANLDYSIYFRNLFSDIDDQETVAVLDKVYQDEIGHVRNGLKWVNHWKKPEVKLWDFYVTNLPEPLTPQRAKGLIFDSQGRTRVGFDSEFQEKLLHYGHSKGKLPDVWCFRPGSEIEVASNVRPKVIRNLQDDLGYLPLWFVGPDDMVVVSKSPSNALLDLLLKLRKRVPRTILYQELKTCSDKRVGTLHPWSWTQQVQSEWQGLIDKSPEWQQTQIKSIADDFGFGLHRQRSVDLEKALALEFDSNSLLFSPGVIRTAKYACDLDYNYSWVAKKVLSSSGNGIYFFDTLEQFQSFKLTETEELLFERQWQNKLNLSFLYDVNQKGSYFNKGITQFFTSNDGTYRGHIVGHYSHGVSGSILRVLHSKINKQNLVSLLQNKICDLLPKIWPAYRGPVGVDAMIVDSGNKLLLRPVVEINFRRTMGHYSQSLKKILAPNTTAHFNILQKSKLNQTQSIYKTEAGRLCDGLIILTDLEQATKFAATLEVL